jgi:hypothetical protein
MMMASLRVPYTAFLYARFWPRLAAKTYPKMIWPSTAAYPLRLQIPRGASTLSRRVTPFSDIADGRIAAKL